MSRFSSRFSIFVMLCFLPACFLYQKAEPLAQARIVNEQGVVAPDLLRLLALTEVDHDGTIESIVTQTQKSWLRKPGSERWDIEDGSLKNETEIRKIINRLALTQEIAPSKKHYKYLFLLGAITSTMSIRMNYVSDLWQKGIRFDQIVLLAGARPAIAAQGENKESLETLLGSKLDVAPATETELLSLVYDCTAMPEAMRAIPVQVIDVPMQVGSDGAMRRPNTADTIEHWLATKPLPGNVLAISNQPYVAYQDAVLRTYVPSSKHQVETVGCASAEDKKIGILLDTLARILYQEKIRLGR